MNNVSRACELLGRTQDSALSLDDRTETVRDFLNVLQAEGFPTAKHYALFSALVQMGLPEQAA